MRIKFFLFYVFSIFLFCLFFPIFSKNYSASNEMILPTDGDINFLSSNFGYRYLFGKKNFHNGIDFPVFSGSNVYATMSGVVTFSGFYGGYGMCVIILHDNGFKSLYGHLDENINVSTSSYVFAGQVIGHVGPKFLSDGRLNGSTTGPHLHFSLFDDKGNCVSPCNYTYKKIR